MKIIQIKLNTSLNDTTNLGTDTSTIPIVNATNVTR